MMRRIFVPYIGAFGGVERLILSLSAFLHEHGINHRIACFRDTINLSSYAKWPLDIDELGPKRNSLSEAQALRDYCKSATSNNMLLFDLKGAFYAGLANLRDFHLHLTDPPSLLAVESSRHSKAFRRWIQDSKAISLKRRLIGELVHYVNCRGVGRAKTVIAMTQRIASELQTLYSVSAQVIRPGVAEVRTSNAPNPAHNRQTLLSVSRLETSKRIDVAIDALAELNEQTKRLNGQGWTLEVAGGGPAGKELQEYANKRNVGSSVTFLGRVSDEELEAAYQRARIFVMPAVQGYGLPALEALIRGVPVVLHRDSGVSEILENSPWTQVIDRNEQLAAAVSRLDQRLQDGEISSNNRPSVPTDKQWAEQMTLACAWI